MTDNILTLQVIFFGITFIFELIPIIIMIKFRSSNPIKVRSPILLTSNLIGLLFMNAIYFIYEILQSIQADMSIYCKFFVGHFYEFHLMLKIPYVLRLHRIYKVYKLKSRYLHHNEISTKSYLESTYLKYYILIIFSAVIIRIIILTLVSDGNDDFMIPFNFAKCQDRSDSKITSIFWVLNDFFDQFCLITIIYKIWHIRIKYKQHIELVLFSINWIIYPNSMRLSTYLADYQNITISSTTISFLCVMFVNFTVVIIGYLPIIVLICYKRNKYKKIDLKKIGFVNMTLERMTNKDLKDNKIKDISLTSFSSLDLDDYNDIKNYLIQKGNSKDYLNLLDFYKQACEVEFQEISREDLINEYELLFYKYFNRESEYFVVFPTEITNICVDKYKNLCGDLFKINVFEDAINFAKVELSKLQIPYYEDSKKLTI